MRPSAVFGNHRWVAVPLSPAAHGLSSVSKTALLVLGALIAQADEGGQGEYSGAELAERIGKSRKTIENALAELGKHPELELRRGRFRIMLGPPIDPPRPFKQEETPENRERETPESREEDSPISGAVLPDSGRSTPESRERLPIPDEIGRSKEAQRQSSGAVPGLDVAMEPGENPAGSSSRVSTPSASTDPSHREPPRAGRLSRSSSAEEPAELPLFGRGRRSA